MAVLFQSLKISLRVLSSTIVFLSYSDQVLAEWTEWLTDTEIAYSFQDNINHAMFSAAEEHDQVWNAVISLGRAYQLTTHTRLDVSALIDGNIHQDFSNLNQINTSVRLALRHKLGIGPYQPWIRASVTSGYLFSDSPIRAGQITTAGIDFGKRLHERFDMAISYRFDYRTSGNNPIIADNKLIAAGIAPGKSNDVFDLVGHSIGAQLNTLFTDQWLITLAYHYREGDSVSSNSPTLVPQINTIVEAIVNDDALPGWAYRADSNTHHLSIDANYAFLKGHAAFNLGYGYTESHASAFTYRNNRFRVSLIYNF